MEDCVMSNGYAPVHKNMVAKNTSRANQAHCADKDALSDLCKGRNVCCWMNEMRELHLVSFFQEFYELRLLRSSRHNEVLFVLQRNKISQEGNEWMLIEFPEPCYEVFCAITLLLRHVDNYPCDLLAEQI